MGDLKKSNVTDFAASALEREERSTAHKKTVSKIVAGRDRIKDKVISAKVYPETWERFSRITKNQGVSRNSIINFLISQYVKEYEEFL